MAINRGHYETAKLLLDAGVNPAVCKSTGETPLYIVTQRGHAHLIPLLIKMRADPNAKSYIRPKMIALSPWQGERRPRSSIGFRAGGDGLISAIDDDIEAPLHHASLHGKTACVNTLLSMGADVNVRSSLGATPLHKALEGYKMDIVKILLEHGADANVPLLHGRTPLPYAAAQGEVATTRLLLRHGVNPLLRDFVGQAPYDIAKRYGTQELVDILDPSKYPHFSAPKNLQPFS